MSNTSTITAQDDRILGSELTSLTLALKGSAPLETPIDPSNIDLLGNVTVINLPKAKSVLKRELLAWTAPDSANRLKLETVQIHFTKCGRFATIISALKGNKAFALRLACLDPHHQLSTYLLGISFSLASALTQSAARIKQVEHETDELELHLQHGDVVMVDHLAYSHCAIYDDIDKVFYELIGDIDSGKDALMANISDLRSSIMKVQQDLAESTKTACTTVANVFTPNKPTTKLVEGPKSNNLAAQDTMLPQSLHEEKPTDLASTKSTEIHTPVLPSPVDDAIFDLNYEHTPKRHSSSRLNKLVQSWGDIGLTKLMQDQTDPDFASAGSDASIQPDDMCPAMAFGFASHSIAEVQATPKDSFITRDPFLQKRIQYYPNALPASVAIARARSAVGSPGWNPVTRNCEHFVTWAKTGRTVSTQLYEASSAAAIFSASTLQFLITLVFLGLIITWAIGFVLTGDVLLETVQFILTWILKGGIAVASAIFALGIFVHWQNGTNANFDDWIATNEAINAETQESGPSS